jgi:hypothetical protein
MPSMVKAKTVEYNISNIVHSDPTPFLGVSLLHRGRLTSGAPAAKYASRLTGMYSPVPYAMIFSRNRMLSWFNAQSPVSPRISVDSVLAMLRRHWMTRISRLIAGDSFSDRSCRRLTVRYQDVGHRSMRIWFSVARRHHE